MLLFKKIKFSFMLFYYFSSISFLFFQFISFFFSFLEECFTIKDPFAADGALCVGSRCSLCSKKICVGKQCGLFYTKRFCIQCLKTNISQFPNEIQQELARISSKA